MITIGCDPDSDKHGISIYEGGKLTKLLNLQLMDIHDMLEHGNYTTDLSQGVVFSIENVLANNFVYGRNRRQSKAVEAQILRSVGRCQQAQLELQRLLEWHDIPYVLHKPQKGNWADNKAQFEKVTGWKGRSNPDTRSAAYFGYLQACK